MFPAHHAHKHGNPYLDVAAFWLADSITKLSGIPFSPVREISSICSRQKELTPKAVQRPATIANT